MKWYPDLFPFETGLTKYVPYSCIIEHASLGTPLPYHKRRDLGEDFIQAYTMENLSSYSSKYDLVTRLKVPGQVLEGLVGELGRSIYANPCLGKERVLELLNEELAGKAVSRSLILRNPHITIDMFDDVLRAFPNSIRELTFNPNIKSGYMLANEHLEWCLLGVFNYPGEWDDNLLEYMSEIGSNRFGISNSYGVSDGMIQKLLNPFDTYGEGYPSLIRCLKCPNIPIRPWLSKYGSVKYSILCILQALRKRPMDFEDILWIYKNHPSMGLARCDFWKAASSNSKVTLKVIKDNPQYPWSVLYMAINPSITLEDIVTYIKRAY